MCNLFSRKDGVIYCDFIDLINVHVNVDLLCSISWTRCSCAEQELTREKAYHLLSPGEGSDYLEQHEGMTSHSQ